MNTEEGTELFDGTHVVPPGVAVEILDGGKKKLSEVCPDDLKALLLKKDALGTYEFLVKAIVEESKTRSIFGEWKDREFISIIDLFAEEFAEAGIRVALCKRKSGSGTKRWLEFIDTEEAPSYVPQFDVANFSGQTINTVYTKLYFPEGVAVEELKEWGKSRNRLVTKAPIYVEKMMQAKGLEEEYAQLVTACAAEGVGKKFKNWNTTKLQEIITQHSPRFEAKGIDLYIAHKEEYVSHGQYGGHMEHYRWIEFVDREKQPNYKPQRDAETKSEKCIIS